jgi:hypothetical protein
MGELENSCTILVENPERKRPIGRLRCRSENNFKIKMAIFWVFAQYRLVEVH